MYEYYFLIDNKFDAPYKFTARFYNHDEASRFIKENENEGNEVIILKPFFRFIPDAVPFEF